jgi:hypothetical protein
MQEKLDKKFLISLIKDAIGYENGFVKTTWDLVRVPDKVVQSVKNGETIYVNPTRYLLNCCGYFILINSFIIDWKAVGKRHDAEYSLLMGPDANITNFMQMTEFLFSTAFVPIILLTGILKLFIISRMAKEIDVSLKEHIAVVFYTAAMGTFLTFLISLVFAVLPFLYSMILNLIYALLVMIFPARLLTIRNVDAFLPEKKEALLKIYKRSDLIIVISITLIMVVYAIIENEFILR